MKKLFILAFLGATTFSNAQAFSGKGDAKVQIGANIQEGGTGIHASADFGLGENLSYGFSATYLLSVENAYDRALPDDAKFQDRIDAKFRLNANLGSVFQLDQRMDIYPGLNLGLKNFGAHLGFRYFFTDGFGVFGEAGIPIAKYDNDVIGVEHYHNQFVFNLGASFNL